MNLCGVILWDWADVRDVQKAVRTMAAANVMNILLVSSRDRIGEAVGALGSGQEEKCLLTYKVLDQSKGVAHALTSSFGFVKDCCCVMVVPVGFEGNLFEHVSAYLKQAFNNFNKEKDPGARILLEDIKGEVVAEMDGDKIKAIQEEYDDGLAVAGIYFFDKRMFSYINGMQPDEVGDFGVAALLRRYLEDDALEFEVISEKEEGESTETS